VPAPQALPEPPSPTPNARVVLAQLRQEFGDASLIRSASLGPPPPVTLRHVRGYFAGQAPPPGGIWLYASAPASKERRMLVDWEFALFAAGLRDRLCAARSSPLIGWSNVAGETLVVSDAVFPFGLRFPATPRSMFRSVVENAAARYDADLVSLRFVHGRQDAPIVVLKARDRDQFAKAAPALMSELDPRNGEAPTWEGLFLEAVDDHGPFLRLSRVMRGEVSGGQWAWDECHLPFPHSQPVGAPSC
jgi:hypothetical protein